jgi:hypothetical protein
MERQVLASAQAKLDTNRILEALEVTNRDDRKSDTVPSSGTVHPWKVAVAASLLCSAAVLVLSKYNLFLTLVVAAGVFLVAAGDPVDDDSLVGAVARVVGRATLQSVEASQPKVRAVARAVVTGQDEVNDLQQRLLNLETENAELRKWKIQRIKAEDCLADYSLPILKDQAREHNLQVSGTKLQLLMRLVDAGVVEL